VNIARIRELLKGAGLSPKKAFGQNFLVSESALAVVAEACVPAAEVGRARVVELGAGLGALTSLLVSRARHVTAVERDRDLIPILESTLQEPIASGRLSVSESDAQRFDVAGELATGEEGPRVLCGNLPYQITGQLLRLATVHAESLDRVVFMVQEEVADRLMAKPSTKAYGALTIFVRAAFDAERCARVPAGAFFPAPNVSSALVALLPVRPPRARETETFRALVKGAFATRRKTLRNAWRGVIDDRAELERVAAEATVSLDVRGETLDVEAFARVAACIDRAASWR
jgi:16S rRNA (adenine1518-N6/adenine1519-N6)-dimethyltransferase